MLLPQEEPFLITDSHCPQCPKLEISEPFISWKTLEMLLIS